MPRTLTDDDAPGSGGPPANGAAPAEPTTTSEPGRVVAATRGSALREREPATVVMPSTPTTVMPTGEPAPPTVTERLVGPQIPTELPVASTISTHDIAPVPRVLGRRPRVRKVTRVVRHVDPWSVFKIAAVFNLILYGITLTAGVLLWNVAYATGTVDNMERFFESFGWDEFEFKGGEIFHNLWIAGLFGVVGLTGAAVLGATLFNLITDLVGGVRMTVLEEEVVERTTAPMRRFVVRRPTLEDLPPDGVRPHPAGAPGTSAGMIRPSRLPMRLDD